MTRRFPTRFSPPHTPFHDMAEGVIAARLGRPTDGQPDEVEAVNMLASQLRKSRIWALRHDNTNGGPTYAA
jgi:hypothetical protein